VSFTEMRKILRGAASTKFTCQESPHALVHEKNGICAKVCMKVVFLQSCDGFTTRSVYAIHKSFYSICFQSVKIFLTGSTDNRTWLALFSVAM